MCWALGHVNIVSEFMNIKKILCCFSIILSIPSYSEKLTILDETFSLKENSRLFSGIAIVTRDNTEIFNYSNGLLVNNKELDINTKTQFVIGSLSKQITATLVLREVEEGRLKLEDSISAYFPELNKKWGAKVTIRHLLNHTSGIANFTDPLNSEPGKVFAYSNLGYNLLGKIVAITSGKSYSLLGEKLFQLCEMNDSVSPDLNSQSNESLIDGFNENELGNIDLVSSQITYSAIPSGGIISTAYDLSKWNQCLHKGGILSTIMHQKMVEKHSDRQHRWGSVGYGFGLQVSSNQENKEWSHSGYVPGYISTMAYYPESDVSLIILENISWNTNDIGRVFYYHDKLRENLLAMLKNKA